MIARAVIVRVCLLLFAHHVWAGQPTHLAVRITFSSAYLPSSLCVHIYRFWLHDLPHLPKWLCTFNPPFLHLSLVCPFLSVRAPVVTPCVYCYFIQRSNVLLINLQSLHESATLTLINIADIRIIKMRGLIPRPDTEHAHAPLYTSCAAGICTTGVSTYHTALSASLADVGLASRRKRLSPLE